MPGYISVSIIVEGGIFPRWSHSFYTFFLYHFDWRCLPPKQKEQPSPFNNYAFNRITNILPFPNSLSTVKVPLCASTKSREIDKPKPLPCTFVPGTRK